MKTLHGIANLSIIPLRATASHKAEMISQVLFGEVYSVEETQDNWLKIKLLKDEYVGWIDKNQHQTISEDYFSSYPSLPFAVIKSLSAMAVHSKNNTAIMLSMGAILPNFNNENFIIGDDIYTLQSGEYLFLKEQIFNIHSINLAKSLLNVPYLWGGKSAYGIDCSGFSQLIYAFSGISLKRDAWQQALDGKLIDNLEIAQLGDLAFFENDKGKITHVGILINQHEIIHASGRVKIDAIDNIGILPADTTEYSHKLKLIKRYFIN